MKSVAILAAVAAAFVLPGVSLWAWEYTVTDFGTLGGTFSTGKGINAGGKVVGHAALAGGIFHAALFNGAGPGITDLGTLGGTTSTAESVNAAGQVVGQADTGTGSQYRATLFGATNLDLGTLGGTNSAAKAINASGQIVGFSYVAGDASYHATLFSGTGSNNVDLGTLGGAYSSANAINAAGQVAGDAINTSIAGNPYRATLFSGTGSNNVDLGTLGGRASFANGINAAGQVVGYAHTADSRYHAALYSGTGTGNTDLGTLGGINSTAYAINASGQIVGDSYDANVNVRGFVYTAATGMVDLNTLIDPAGGWLIVSAMDINDAGEITGFASKAGENHAILLTPDTPPSAGPSPASAAAPGIQIAGKKKIFTTRAKRVIKGATTGSATSVTGRVGTKGAYKPAKGPVTGWKFTAKLKPGKNKVTMIAHGPGGDSAPAKVTVVRE